jgi:hypothetical protein
MLYLRQTTDSGPQGVPLAIAGNLATEDPSMRKVIWPRSDQAHVAAQDIQDLGQLVETAFAKQTTNRSYAVEFQMIIGSPAGSRPPHASKFDHGEGAALSAHADLHKKQGPWIKPGIDAYQDGDHQE